MDSSTHLSVLRACQAVASSEFRAREAYLLWVLVRNVGAAAARREFPNGTYYRLREVLERANVPITTALPPLLEHLPGAHFRVLTEIDAEYPVGQCGVVEALMLEAGGEWAVRIAPDHDHTSLTELPLGEFLPCVRLAERAPADNSSS